MKSLLFVIFYCVGSWPSFAGTIGEGDRMVTLAQQDFKEAKGFTNADMRDPKAFLNSLLNKKWKVHSYDARSEFLSDQEWRPGFFDQTIFATFREGYKMLTRGSRGGDVPLRMELDPEGLGLTYQGSSEGAIEIFRFSPHFQPTVLVSEVAIRLDYYPDGDLTPAVTKIDNQAMGVIRYSHFYME